MAEPDLEAQFHEEKNTENKEWTEVLQQQKKSPVKQLNRNEAHLTRYLTERKYHYVGLRHTSPK